MRQQLIKEYLYLKKNEGGHYLHYLKFILKFEFLTLKSRERGIFRKVKWLIYDKNVNIKRKIIETTIN